MHANSIELRGGITYNSDGKKLKFRFKLDLVKIKI